MGLERLAAECEAVGRVMVLERESEVKCVRLSAEKQVHEIMAAAARMKAAAEK
jgi:hypothetical protein